MIPILYNYDETAFTTRGIGALSDCISCTVTEVLNGEYSLTMKYPKNGIHQDALEVRNIIVCQPNHTMERQAFRISKVNRSMKDSITVTAYQLAYDLSNYPIIKQIDVKGVARAISALKTTSNLLWALPSLYSISTTLTNTTSEFIVPSVSSVRSWFGGREGSLIDIFGGEWEYNFGACVLTASRGSDNGARLSYGVNLAEYVKERIDGAYSHVIPFFYKKNEDTDVLVTGNSIATGYTATQKAYMLDVTGMMDEEYGKTYKGFDTYNKSQKTVSNSQFVDISTSSYYSHIRMTGTTSWAQMSTDNGYVAKEWVYPNNSGIISSPTTLSAGGGSVFTAKEGINYRIKASSFHVYCALVVVFTGSTGTVLSQTQYTFTNVDSGINAVAPSGSAFMVLIPIVNSNSATTSPSVVAYQNMTLTSIPTVAEVTAQGTAYFAMHPELAADTQTISVKPDLISTEVSLGDTVHVVYDDEMLSTRVVKTIWNVLAEKYDALEIGTVKQNIAQTIKNLR